MLLKHSRRAKIISTYTLLGSAELDHEEDRRAHKWDKVYAGYPEVPCQCLHHCLCDIYTLHLKYEDGSFSDRFMRKRLDGFSNTRLDSHVINAHHLAPSNPLPKGEQLHGRTLPGLSALCGDHPGGIKSTDHFL